MKQWMKGLVTGVLATVLLMGTLTVFAAATRTIEVTFGEVAITLLGREVVVRDGQGAVLETITYDGQVYVPMDVILYAMGNDVQWNAANSVLNFGAMLPEGGQPLVEVAPWFSASRSVDIRPTINVRGETFRNAIRYFNPGFGGVIYSNHALDGQFTLLTGVLGRSDETPDGRLGVVRFMGDGRLLDSFTVNDGFGLESFSIDVTGVNTLRIELENTPGARAPRIAIIDAKLH